jgi:hypothetical protein
MDCKSPSIKVECGPFGLEKVLRRQRFPDRGRTTSDIRRRFALEAEDRAKIATSIGNKYENIASLAAEGRSADPLLYLPVKHHQP